MSDSYCALVDREATEESAAGLGKTAIERLISLGLVEPKANADCVLGGQGYPMANTVDRVYSRIDREVEYWNMQVNSVEVHVGRWFNMFGTTVMEWIACPDCKTKYKLTDNFGDSFAKEVGHWLKGAPLSPIVCEACGNGSQIDEWESRPHLGFANLALLFWNWPPLDSTSWAINIPELLTDTLGHKLILTYGRV